MPNHGTKFAKTVPTTVVIGWRQLLEDVILGKLVKELLDNHFTPELDRQADETVYVYAWVAADERPSKFNYWVKLVPGNGDTLISDYSVNLEHYIQDTLAFTRAMEVQFYVSGKKEDAVMHWYRFTVAGAGVFPFDMLRRDRCFPYASEDASRMADDAPRLPAREIELASWQAFKQWEPNYERWKSFGWRVVSVVRE